MRPRVCKVAGAWQVHRPGYGFNRDEVRTFRTWHAAVRSLRSAPAAAGSQVAFGVSGGPVLSPRHRAFRVGVVA